MIKKLLTSVFPRFVFFLIVLAAGHNFSAELFGEFSLYQTRVLAIAGVLSYYCQYRFKLFESSINTPNYIFSCFIYVICSCFVFFSVLFISGFEFDFLILIIACVANTMYLLLSYLVVFLKPLVLSIFNGLSTVVFTIILILCFFLTEPRELIILIALGNATIFIATLLIAKVELNLYDLKIIENFKFINFDLRVLLIATLGFPVVAIIQTLLVSYENGLVVVGQVFFCIQFLNISNVFVQRYCQIISPKLKGGDFLSLEFAKFLIVVLLFHSLVLILLISFSKFGGNSNLVEVDILKFFALAFFSIFTSVNFFTTEKLNVDGDVRINFKSNVVWAISSFTIFFSYTYYGGDLFMIFLSSIYLSRVPALIYQYFGVLKLRAVSNNG